MGYSTGGFCHPTLTAAAQYDCGTHYPVVWGSGDSLVVVACSSASEAGLVLSKSFDGGASIPFGVSAVYAECSQTEWMTYTPFSLSASDGIAVVSAVLSVWFIAASYRWVRKALQDRD